MDLMPRCPAHSAGPRSMGRRIYFQLLKQAAQQAVDIGLLGIAEAALIGF
jgi:hypothetical protein